MKLSTLLHQLGAQLKHPSIEIEGITADSRQVEPGYLFVAQKGVSVDGHDYIAKAIDAGAAAIVCERIPAFADEHHSIEWISVPDAAVALGAIADQWYGNPSSHLTLVGVTGTNGKTTIATLLYDMARLMRHKAGLLSTVANKIDGKELPAKQTTPDIITINRLLRDMVDAGCTFCSMEASSHACHQKRIAGLKFAGGVFTNLTRDHLDYHLTFANYLAAKKSFFDALPPEAFALTNADDRNGAVMLQNTKARRATYSLCRPADFVGHVVEDTLHGMIVTFNGTEVHTAFMGRFNASNLTAVYGASIMLGWDKMQVLRCISLLRPVAGRMQTIVSPDGIAAIVDYAHTPDAIANVLDTVRETIGRGHIITVTGAGGDRDPGKRPLMAAEAAKRSDMVVLTSDNPRSEDPREIAAQMLAGVPEADQHKTITIIDRADAIAHALSQAHAGDAVVIVGKGHENYQIIGSETRHFDDREQVEKYFNL